MKKKIFLFLLIFIILFLNSYQLNALPYRSYTYNFWEESIPIPAPYLPDKVIDGFDLGVGEFDFLADIEVSNNYGIYILDSGKDQLIIANKNWEKINKIEQFNNNGKTDSLNNPRSVFVTEKGDIFIADRDNARIIVLNQQGELINEIQASASEEIEGIIPEDFRFRPIEVAYDEQGDRMYVIASGIYDGIMEFDGEGAFRGFIGAPRVSPNPIDVFWRRIATEEQRRKMTLFLPIEYNSLALDDEGFIFATVAAGGGDEVIKKLNPSGEDILQREGFHPQIGDVNLPSNINNSTFIDIIPQKDGVYRVLDRQRGRIFTYDHSGNLLYVFGSKGDQKGAVKNPRAIENKENKIIVLGEKDINIFSPTKFSNTILSAIEYYNSGKYLEAREMWENVRKMNVNYELAYKGIGRSYFRDDQFEKAMKNFRQGNFREEYSKAFEYYRAEVIEENFLLGFIIIFLFIFFVLFLKYGKNKYNKRDFSSILINKTKNINNFILSRIFMKSFILLKKLYYSLYVIFHPVDGFWELKHEKKGNILSALVILLFTIFTYVFMRQYTGFIFNERRLKDLNIIMESISILLPFILWSTVNWGLTTLMEGKGTIKDIMVATSYALTPIILLNIPLTFLSHFMTIQEGLFYYFSITFAVMWSMGLLFLGIMVTHEYTLTKNIFTTIFTIIGIVVVLFLGLSFIILLNQAYMFLYDVYNELLIRYIF